jgi:hypothetical protein
VVEAVLEAELVLLVELVLVVEEAGGVAWLARVCRYWKIPCVPLVPLMEDIGIPRKKEYENLTSEGGLAASREAYIRVRRFFIERSRPITAANLGIPGELVACARVSNGDF